MVGERDLNGLGIEVGCNRCRALDRIEDQNGLLNCAEIDVGQFAGGSNFTRGGRVPDRRFGPKDEVEGAGALLEQELAGVGGQVRDSIAEAPRRERRGATGITQDGCQIVKRGRRQLRCPVRVEQAPLTTIVVE